MKHLCHWPSCEVKVPAKMWGCSKHWFKLPIKIRNIIWSTYRAGQETSKRPFRAYIIAAKQAQEWIREQTKG